MSVLNKGPGFVLSLLLAGCASVGGTPGGLNSSTWDNNGCYHSMLEDIRHLAAGPIVDCGFIGTHTDADSDDRVRDCARQVAGGNQGYIFGHLGIGDDSWFCDVVVRSSDGQLWSLYFDSDVTGQMGMHGDHSRVWLSRCDALRFPSDTVNPNTFYTLDGCKDAPDALQRMIAQRGRS